MFLIARVRTRIDGPTRESTRATSIPQVLPADSTWAEFVRCYQSIEQDHRMVKKRTWLAKGYGSFPTGWRTLQGNEAMHMIRKGRARWVAKDDAVAQATFVAELFGLTA